MFKLFLPISLKKCEQDIFENSSVLILNILSRKSFQRARVRVKIMNLSPTKTFLYCMNAYCFLNLFVQSAAATRSVSAIFVKQLNLLPLVSYVHFNNTDQADPLKLISVFM